MLNYRCHSLVGGNVLTSSLCLFAYKLHHSQLLQPFNGLCSRTTWVSQYQKGKINLDFTGARDSEWQWHQLGRMQVCTSLQTDNRASTPPLCFFTGRMPFLPPNQQRQSTEGICITHSYWVDLDFLDLENNKMIDLRRVG